MKIHSPKKDLSVTNVRVIAKATSVFVLGLDLRDISKPSNDPLKDIETRVMTRY